MEKLVGRQHAEINVFVYIYTATTERVNWVCGLFVSRKCVFDSRHLRESEERMVEWMQTVEVIRNKTQGIYLEKVVLGILADTYIHKFIDFR